MDLFGIRLFWEPGFERQVCKIEELQLGGVGVLDFECLHYFELTRGLAGSSCQGSWFSVASVSLISNAARRLGVAMRSSHYLSKRMAKE